MRPHQAEDSAGENDDQDPDCALEKKLIRQNQDDRVGARIKQPVIVPEQDRVKRHEQPVPLEDGQKAQRNGNHDRQDPRDPKAPGRMLPPECPDQGKNPCRKAQDLDNVKDHFAVRKVDPPALTHDKVGKVQLPPVPEKQIIAEHVIVPANNGRLQS